MKAPGSNARKVNGVPHLRNCACSVCDPGDTKRLAQREKFLAEQAARAAAPAPVVLAKSAGARPLRYAVTDETRRLQQLFREGKTYAEASAVIEAEKTQRKANP